MISTFQKQCLMQMHTRKKWCMEKKSNGMLELDSPAVVGPIFAFREP